VIDVLLMSAQSKASGANLQVATHVILLDPAGLSAAHGAALEQQAIGRAVRMGQTRQVTVTRFVVDGTLEGDLVAQIRVAAAAADARANDTSYQIAAGKRALETLGVARAECRGMLNRLLPPGAGTLCSAPAVLGVPASGGLGLIAGLLDVIPMVGPIIAAVPAVLLAFTVSPVTALWTIGLFLLVQQLQGNFLQPMIQKQAVDVPPAVLLFAVVAAGSLFGFLGVLLAAPLTVVVFVLVQRIYVRTLLGKDIKVAGRE
jgi:hypothetical protein